MCWCTPEKRTPWCNDCSKQVIERCGMRIPPNAADQLSHPPSYPTVNRLPLYYDAPIGCICPAGANKDCENPTCPRKKPTE